MFQERNSDTMVADPVLAATDVASTVFDQPVRELAIPIVETPVSDQIFDLIIGGTPDTNFIKDSIEKKEKGVAKGIRENGKDKSVNSYDAQVTADQTVISVIVEERDNSDNTDKINESINVTSDDIEKEDLETSCGNLMNSLSDSFTESTYKRGWSVDSTQSQSGPAFGRIFADFEASNPFMFVNSENLDVGYNTLSADSTPSPDSSRSDDAEKLNYEVVPGQPLSPEDMGRLLPVLTRLTTEEGLDSQAYQCYECKSYIGMIYGKPRVCSYDSKYYCYECHEEEMTLIPSRLIHNWDFGSYGVCRKNGRWLYAIHHQPLIDLRTVNPKLYCHVDDLAEMQILRTQLLYVRAYLFTCKSDAGENLRKMLWPRDHMYEHVHLYSVSDLLLVGQGQLVPEVRQAVTFGRDHVIHCDMCLPRGFICELCSDKEIIFPFQLGSTYTCGECYGVYHSACARGQKDCRRCVRREARKASIVDDTEE
ncbi:zinc ion binding [Halocaridina rubra]|uniref:Zinc ion binding n=1 Tax=Halocaridina rubra TaxID=373956 RepID=A0AAN8WS74_HALRR